MCVSAVPRYGGTSARSSRSREWLSFFVQVILVTSVELSDEVLRGMIAQSNSAIGQIHADNVVRLEAAHGMWVDPAWQRFFELSHYLLGITITWDRVVPIANSM